MRRYYSRLARVEERRNIRNTVVFSVLTIGIVAGLIFYGLPLLVKFSSFLTDIKKSNSAVDISDITPPGPPIINQVPEFTNKSPIEISGTAESGAVVVVTINDKSQEVIAGNDGVFSLKADLIKGQNTISAIARDAAGNKSVKTKTIYITLDSDTPNIDISNPHDGQQFGGSKQKEITISGNTKSQSIFTVNDRLIRLDDSGNFSYSYTLSDGDNTLNFKSIDKAGNTTEKSITVHFSS
jgi:hypothetical protein